MWGHISSISLNKCAETAPRGNRPRCFQGGHILLPSSWFREICFNNCIDTRVPPNVWSRSASVHVRSKGWSVQRTAAIAVADLKNQCVLVVACVVEALGAPVRVFLVPAHEKRRLEPHRSVGQADHAGNNALVRTPQDTRYRTRRRTWLRHCS